MCTDISKEMLKLAKNKFDDPASDYNAISGNKYFITDEYMAPLDSHNFDLEAEIRSKGYEDHGRFVFGCRANNESLPFADSTFDCYISNLSIHLVHN